MNDRNNTKERRVKKEEARERNDNEIKKNKENSPYAQLWMVPRLSMHDFVYAIPLIL